jgi:hypothetical protein
MMVAGFDRFNKEGYGGLLSVVPEGFPYSGCV